MSSLDISDTPTTDAASPPKSGRLALRRRSPPCAIETVSVAKPLDSYLGMELADSSFGVIVQVVHAESTLSGRIAVGAKLTSIDGQKVTRADLASRLIFESSSMVLKFSQAKPDTLSGTGRKKTLPRLLLSPRSGSSRPPSR